jgi:CoA:oxalate CoA-transferase
MDAHPSPQPFAGVRILEVGGTVAAAGATKTLSDYGADVIKVEAADGGHLRRLPPFPDDRPNINHGAFHLGLDTGKRSIVVDTTTASGEAILVALAASSDVLLMDLSPERAQRVMAMLDDLGKSAPSVVAMSPHGLDGPYAGRVESDLTLFALSNRMGRHSFDDQEPLRYSAEVATLQWASTATAVTAAAIWGRQHDGKRRMVEVAGVEALAANVDSWFVQWSFTGASTPRPAGPSRATYPTGYLPCRDGYVSFFAGAPPFFGRLCRAIGHPEFADDPRFTDPAQKPKHFDEFMGYLQPYLDSRTRDEVFTELQAHGVMVAPLLDVSEALCDRQAVARGSYVEFEQPGMGKHLLPGPPFRLADAWRLRPAPDLGQHTEELLSELGYSRPEQVALFRAGVTM